MVYNVVFVNVDGFLKKCGFDKVRAETEKSESIALKILNEHNLIKKQNKEKSETVKNKFNETAPLLILVFFNSTALFIQ